MIVRYFPQQFFHGGGGSSGHANPVGKGAAGKSGTVSIGGMNVKVKRDVDHVFGNGTSTPDPLNYTFKADAYMLPNGTTLFFKKNMSSSDQTLTPEQLITAISRIDARVADHMQRVIEVVDYENPRDAYWRSVYTNFSRSYMTGGSDIVIYKYSSKHDDDYLVISLAHEIGHGMDTDIGKSYHGISSSARWAAAVAADNDHTKKLLISQLEAKIVEIRTNLINAKAPDSTVRSATAPYERDLASLKRSPNGLQASSTYGLNSAAEDFAESVSHYSNGVTEHSNYNSNWSVPSRTLKGSFADVFPNRTAIIEEALQNGTVNLSAPTPVQPST